MKRALALLALAIACGDDDRVGNASGVEGGKRLDALSSEELRRVCRWYVEVQLQGDARDRLCVPNAVFSSEDQAACEADRDACHANFPALREQIRSEQLSACDQAVIGEDCYATVHQLEACILDRMERWSAYLEQLSCAQPMPGAGVDDDLFDSEACVPVNATCVP